MYFAAERKASGMDGETRRKEIIKFISESDAPVSGTKLANHFHVSRQVIVQDIALLRAADWPIISTYRGYLCQSSPKRSRVLKVFQKKPYIKKESCVRCGVCVESCPVDGKALRFKNGRNMAPVYDYKKCIRCFCCQEMCPHKAIDVKRF